MGPGEIFVGVCIVVNVMVAFVQLEMRGRAAGAEIGSASSGDYESTLERLSFVTLAFTLFFAVEQVVKLSVLGCQLFRAHHQLQWFNIFDATIVVLSVIDECLASTVDTGSNFSVLRGFRVIRVLRVLRIARSLKAFVVLAGLAVFEDGGGRQDCRSERALLTSPTLAALSPTPSTGKQYLRSVTRPPRSGRPGPPRPRFLAKRLSSAPILRPHRHSWC